MTAVSKISGPLHRDIETPQDTYLTPPHSQRWESHYCSMISTRCQDALQPLSIQGYTRNTYVLPSSSPQFQFFILYLRPFVLYRYPPGSLHSFFYHRATPVLPRGYKYWRPDHINTPLVNDQKETSQRTIRRAYPEAQGAFKVPRPETKQKFKKKWEWYGNGTCRTSNPRRSTNVRVSPLLNAQNSETA